ncbi:MAG: bile acid:sodium symporter family protein [Spirosomataceae bacterium]|jgi:sodium/bile acid cotransporter 7
MKKIKIDGFVLSIIIVVILAYLFPYWGSKSSPIPIDLISSVGVSLIFFFYGLKLNKEKLTNGLKNWRLHILVQLSTFLLFPLIIIFIRPAFLFVDATEVWLGFLFLAALPSTVSSSVVMVSLARGNILAAIFNASISGLIGILVTPLWMGSFLHHVSEDFQLGSVYLKLITEILLPVALGLFLQPKLGSYATRFNSWLTTFDKSVILLIIYKSFCSSFLEKVFESVNLVDLLYISAGVLILFFVVFYLTGFLAKRLKFNREDTITAQFCGTKKSLVHGTVFSKILFPSTMPVGLILLPLMLFHAFQLFIVSIIATRLSREI